MREDEVTVEDGFILVRNEEIASVDEARKMTRLIDRTIRDTGFTRVLFDTRVTKAPSQAVNNKMWAWVYAKEHHERLAIVVESLQKRATGNITARAIGASLKSFSDYDEALAWLLSDDE